MKKQNGFIATSLLYTFFLAFIGLFVGMITIYLQNRVYLIKLEDSSKNAIYIREINEKGNIYAYINENISSSIYLTQKSKGIYIDETTDTEYILAKCEQIYYESSYYYLNGCPTLCATDNKYYVGGCP